MSPLGIKILAGLALVLAICIGLGLWGAHQEALGRAQADAAQAQQALAGERAARAESDRRVASQQENLNEDQRFASARAADAAGLDAVARRLHDDAARGRLGAADPAAAAASQGSGMPAAPMVRADVYFRALDAAVVLAKHVDCLHGVSELCARDYDALTPRP